MSKIIGIIAEDRSDVQVIEAILSKYSSKNTFSVRQFVGNGCGKLRNKCGAWTKALFERGCHHVFVFHDLDRESEPSLRRLLLEKVPQLTYPSSLVVIPIEELEAWLLSDSGALQKVFNLKKPPKKIANCEQVASPKEFLGNLIWKEGRKRYLNTVHNRKIAEELVLDELLKCPSYAPFDKYIKEKVFKPIGVRK